MTKVSDDLTANFMTGEPIWAIIVVRRQDSGMGRPYRDGYCGVIEAGGRIVEVHGIDEGSGLRMWFSASHSGALEVARGIANDFKFSCATVVQFCMGGDRFPPGEKKAEEILAAYRRKKTMTETNDESTDKLMVTMTARWIKGSGYVFGVGYHDDFHKHSYPVKKMLLESLGELARTQETALLLEYRENGGE